MRLHPLSAVVDTVRRAVLGFTTAFFAVTMASGPLGLGAGELLFVLAPAGALVGATYAVARYLRFEYELTGDSLDVRSGVFGRQDREIPLRRVQNVDVQRSLLHRLLGVAVVRVETAGGGSTEAILDFVSDGEARRLQRGLRGRGASSGDADRAPAATDESDEAGARDAGEHLLFELSLPELLLFAFTTFRPGTALLIPFAVPLGEDVAVGVVLALADPIGGPATLSPGALTPDAALALAVVALPLAAASAWLVGAALSLVGYYGFRLARAGDDLLYERGLLREYGGTIPIGKVQTLTLREPLGARHLGYAGLRVETAGYSPDDRRSQRPTSAVPLARRDRALALARRIQPFDDLSFERPPPRARRRYAVRYLLAVCALTAAAYAVAASVGGFARWYAPLALLPAVPVAAHLKWANRGYHAGAECVALRAGFWRRSTHVVPYDRLQTVVTERSVFQRRYDLASVVADTASSAALFAGDATAHDVSTADARRLHRLLRERLGAPESPG